MTGIGIGTQRKGDNVQNRMDYGSVTYGAVIHYNIAELGVEARFKIVEHPNYPPVQIPFSIEIAVDLLRPCHPGNLFYHIAARGKSGSGSFGRCYPKRNLDDQPIHIKIGDRGTRLVMEF